VRPLRLYWSTSKPNFGDALSPLICARVSGRVIEHAPVARCDLIALGSLMQRVKEHFWTRRITVWGTGFIGPEAPRRSRHRYCAVRGKLTASIVRAGDDVVLGDPGLLASMLLEGEPPAEARIRCLVIPHYKDRDHPRLQELVRQFPWIEVADVFQPPLDLLGRIRSSEIVLSSAMHGLIAADSLGVPNAWLKLSDELRGGDFKFRDYYSVFGIEPVPTEPSAALIGRLGEIAAAYARPGIDRVKAELVRCFPRDI
jgi:pyruvyltransferase